MIRRYHVGAGEHQFITAPECRTVDRCDDRLAELLKRGKGGLRRVGRRARRLDITGFADLEQFLNIGTGDKGTPCAGNHHGVYVILMLELLHDGVQFIERTFVKRIHRWVINHQ